MRPELAGLVHGAAELLPVSSSAHARALGASHEQAVAMAAGAAGPVVWLWRRDLLPLRPGLQIMALLPPTVAGALARPRLGTTAGLVAGAAAMAASDRAGGRRRAAQAGWRDGVALGVAQAVALSPGVSRLGATVVAARLRGFARADAAALAREVALPVTLAAVARTAPRLRSAAPAAGRAALASATGAFAAAPLGRLAAGPLWPLALYRLALAALLRRRGA